MLCHYSRLGPRTEWVASIRQPRQARHFEQPRRQLRQLIGRNAQQFQLRAIGQALRQRLQPVASQHQLLQLLALTNFWWQRFQLIIGENKPAQRWRECRRRQHPNVVGLEAHHAQLRTLAQYGGHFGELIVGTKQHPQLVQLT